MYKDNLNDEFIYRISEKESNYMNLTAINPNRYHIANYLGAIVSADRSVIYWINYSKPLP